MKQKYKFWAKGSVTGTDIKVKLEGDVFVPSTGGDISETFAAAEAALKACEEECAGFIMTGTEPGDQRLPIVQKQGKPF